MSDIFGLELKVDFGLKVAPLRFDVEDRCSSFKVITGLMTMIYKTQILEICRFVVLQISPSRTIGLVIRPTWIKTLKWSFSK